MIEKYLYLSMLPFLIAIVVFNYIVYRVLSDYNKATLLDQIEKAKEDRLANDRFVYEKIVSMSIDILEELNSYKNNTIGFVHGDKHTDYSVEDIVSFIKLTVSGFDINVSHSSLFIIAGVYEANIAINDITVSIVKIGNKKEFNKHRSLGQWRVIKTSK